MGNFYDNITLRGPSRNEVLGALNGRDAIVSKKKNGCVVVYDSDIQSFETLPADLSRKLKCAALAVMNHDDDVLVVTLYEHGEPSDSYNSHPNYFDAKADGNARGGDAKKLCQAFGSSKVKEVESVLRGDFVMEYERHRQLVAFMGISQDAVCLGYKYIREREAEEAEASGRKDAGAAQFVPPQVASILQMLSQNPDAMQSLTPDADGMKSANVEVHAVKFNGRETSRGSKPGDYSYTLDVTLTPQNAAFKWKPIHLTLSENPISLESAFNRNFNAIGKLQRKPSLDGRTWADDLDRERKGKHRIELTFLLSKPLQRARLNYFLLEIAEIALASGSD